MSEGAAPEFYKQDIPPGLKAFSASQIIKTKSHKMDKDHEPPSLKNLDANNMPNATALATMIAGIDQTLVHGAQTVRVEDERQILTLKKETREIVEDQEQVVHGKADLTYEHGGEVTTGDTDALTANGVQESLSQDKAKKLI